VVGVPGQTAFSASIDYVVLARENLLSMVNFVLPTEATFLPEQWAEYGIGVFIIFLRYFVRIRTVGFRGFQGDDYITVLVWPVRHEQTWNTVLPNCSEGPCLNHHGRSISQYRL
jgi:hypothetical protein